MKLLERPLSNLKSINLKLIAFVGVFMAVILFAAIPKNALGDFGTGLQFMFSPGFYTPVENNTTDLTTKTMNNIYQVMNFAKVIFWSMTFIGVIVFLFRKPAELDVDNQNLDGYGSKEKSI